MVEKLVDRHVVKVENAHVKGNVITVSATISDEVMEYIRQGDNVIDIHIVDKKIWEQSKNT